MWWRVLACTALLMTAAGCDGENGENGENGAGNTGTTVAPTTTEAPATTTTTAAGGGGERATCSAAGLDADLPAQPELPEPVADTRQDIAAAAAACDYDRLGELARAGDEPFTYSFGDSGDPVGYWRQLEERGGDPLRVMVGILERPFGVVEHDTVRYAWPSAFTYDSWEDVPQTDREALRPLYDEEDFEFFEQFGGYIGYRVVIEADGTWTVFVAGD